MSDAIFKRFLNDVSANEVAGDPTVVAARARLQELQARHREAAAAIEPLRDAIPTLPAQIAEAKAKLDTLQMQTASSATDVFLGGPERAWRDHQDELARARDLVERLALVGPGLEHRLDQASGPVRSLGKKVNDAGFDLNTAIDAARAVVAQRNMSR